MSLRDRFTSSTSTEQTGYEAIQIDGELAETLTTPLDRDAITVRPHKDNGGIESMADVLESLHSVETSSGLLKRGADNISPAHSYLMRYSHGNASKDRVVSLNYLAGDDRTDGTLERQLQTQYPDCQMDRASSRLIPHDNLEERFISGATLRLRRYSLYPIKNIDLPGFTTDPTGSILEEMVGNQDESYTDADVLVQIMFKPASRDWTDGIENGHGIGDDSVRGTPSIKTLSKNLQQPNYEKQWRTFPFTRERVEYPPSKVDKNVAKLLEEQQGEKGWHLCLRVFAISEDRDVAVERASMTAGMFRNFYENNAEQTFVPKPLTQSELRDVAHRAAHREWEDHGIVKAQREVAGLINIPEAEYVNTNKMPWSLSRPGEGIPPGTPRYDFEANDVVGVSEAEKQVSMMTTDDPSEPYWYGWGSRNGTEAGIEPDVLNVHQFVGGATGKGKTTLLKNYFYQVLKRGHGGMFFDPKGRDAEDFLSIVPEDREDDVVFVDLGGDHDKQVGFNFLENPVEGTVDPDTEAFASAIESVADDLAALLAQAGGSDNYWGALMERVTKNLARGFAKSPWDLTILDLYYALSNEDARQRYASHLSDERIAFIEDYAQNQLAEMDDDKLEPLLGRLQQWVENDVIRELIAHPESTVSVEDVIDDGGIIIVRNQTSGETVKRMFATALIRRAWVAVRENPDAPPFFVVCDEFDSIVTEESSIHSILSEARAFDFSITLACQNPSNQLPEQIAKAIQNQCQTFLSFNPGGPDDAKVIAAQHSKDIDWDDLTNMSKYRIYMRTHDENDRLTHSYKVNAFPPIDEVASADIARSEAETKQLIDDLLDKHGTRRRTDAEIKEESRFHPNSDISSDDSEDADLSQRQYQLRALKAIYDESLRQDAEGEYLDITECVPRIRQYLTDTDLSPSDVETLTHNDIWRRILQHIPSTELTWQGDDEARVESRPWLKVGQTQNDGGRAHFAPMRDAYKPLTQVGFIMDIVDQGDGGALPDARCTLDDVMTVPAGASPGQVHEAVEQFKEENPLINRLAGTNALAIESEHSTGTTQPSQTVANASKVSDGQRCLFICRPETAPNVYETLLEEPHGCRMHDGQERFYTGTAIRENGEKVTRPGDRENVWTRDKHTGELVLRDKTGVEHGRFDSLDEALSFDGYGEGDCTVTRPVVPDYDPDDIDVVVVPEGTDKLGDMALYRPKQPNVPLDSLNTETNDNKKNNNVADDSDEDDIWSDDLF